MDLFVECRVYLRRDGSITLIASNIKDREAFGLPPQAPQAVAKKGQIPPVDYGVIQKHLAEWVAAQLRAEVDAATEFLKEIL